MVLRNRRKSECPLLPSEDDLWGAERDLRTSASGPVFDLASLRSASSGHYSK